MNSNEKYFVSLMASHLNSIPPVSDNNIDWKKIFHLSAIHNVTAIAANQILMLSNKDNIPKDILSSFRQQMGYTVMDAQKKETAILFIKQIFMKSNIDFIFVKGAVIRNYYPVKEFRTSADIDVIVKYEDIDKCRSILKEKNIILDDNINYTFSFFYEEQHIEVHCNKDFDHPYFMNIFHMCSKNGCEHVLSDEDHLLYVMCHIIKHFNMYGAGIKMFMDIDVLIRHMKNFDYEDFIQKSRKLGIETFAKAAFSLCNFWFDTPVKSEIDFSKNENFRKLFEEEIISSGSFGFNKRNQGSYYINKGIGKGEKNNIAAKFRAFLFMLFPPKIYLMDAYKYLDKHPILLPFAWINRLFDAVFRRGKQSKNTIRLILKSSKEAEEYKKLLNELDI